MHTRHQSALLEGDTTEKIIGAFYAIYNELGYGFLERVYAGALEIELAERGLPYVRERPFDVEYHRHVVGLFRADFFVVGRVIVEVKSSRRLCEEDHRQLFNYLRATKTSVGLILHFGPQARFHRMIHTPSEMICRIRDIRLISSPHEQRS
jgi:GxxExxY protein